MTRLMLAGLLWITASPAHANTAPPGWHRLDAQLRIKWQTRAHSLPSLAAMYVKSIDVNATARAIHDLGGSVGTISGDILTVRLPLSKLPALADRGEIVHCEGARKVAKRLDKVARALELDAVHAGAAPLSAAYQGSGVVVGVIDLGIDWTHRAFVDSAGNTRIRALWDQKSAGTPPAGYNYGHVCVADEIDTGGCQHQPTESHGTHVAGIAAGSPVADLPYVGIAPRSELIFVNLHPQDGLDNPVSTAICDAAAWIFREAGAAPTVINMSLGEHSGPHDGTSLASQCLNNLTGPGRLMVAAAGNEGEGGVHQASGERVALHASGEAAPDPQGATFLVSAQGEDVVTLWFDDPATVEVRMGFFDDNDDIQWLDQVGVADEYSLLTWQDSRGTLGPLSAAGVVRGNTRGIRLTIADENEDGLETATPWLLEIVGNGRFDAFIDTTSGAGFLPDGASETISVDNAMSIGYPAVAQRVLAVASYATRTQWTVAGNTHRQRSPVSNRLASEGEISAFSSRGPSRNPTASGPKPDIAAPGELVASALFRGATEEAPTRIISKPPNGFVLLEGTSMASPVVAGVVALLLEADPTLDVDDVRATLRTTAQPGPGQADPTVWGAGKVHARAAMATIDRNTNGRAPKRSEGNGCTIATNESWPPLALLLMIWIVSSTRTGRYPEQTL